MLNLTPHAITLRHNGIDTVFPASGIIARVEVSSASAGVCPVTGAPLVSRSKGKVIGIPETGEVCIVSSMVLDACGGMSGVVAPDTGDTAIRNEKGHVVACTQWVVPSPE